MVEYLSFNIAVDITGLLGSFFMIFSFLDRKTLSVPKYRQLFIQFLMLNVLLGCDLVLSYLWSKPNQAVGMYVSLAANQVFCYMIVLNFVQYLRLELGTGEEQWNRFLWFSLLCAAPIMIAILTNPIHKLFFSVDTESGELVGGPLNFMEVLPAILIQLGCVCNVLRQKNLRPLRRLPLLFCSLIGLAAGPIQIRAMNLAVTNMAALVLTLVLYAYNFLTQSEFAARQQLELENTRSELMLAQIKPHFLFNSMTTVMNLCDRDPKEAKAALQELSDYLHYKIPAMSDTYLVDFRQDLDFLKNYLKLEKRRYGSRLNVEYDIRAVDFQIPLMTMQPLVENAIRHGISKKPDGGTVRISTWEMGDTCFLTITDDGVGFDMSSDYNDDLKHVGLLSVRNRLSALCGGGLELKSSVGGGTAVCITVRKGRKEE